MAICPACSASLDVMEVSCRTCGFDFPSTTGTVKSNGSLARRLEEGLLMAGAVVSGFSSLLSALYAFDQLARGELLSAFMTGPVGATFCAAMTVVFIKVGGIAES